MILRVEREAKAGAEQAAASKAHYRWRQGPAIGRELRQPAVPPHVLALAAVLEVVGHPGVALTVEHQLAAAANPAAVEFNGKIHALGAKVREGSKGDGRGLVGGAG